MRRETRDELIRSFLAINAMLREEMRGLKRVLEKRSSETKYNPNWAKQPRAPRGQPSGGQWVDGGPKQLQHPRPNSTPGPRPQRPSLQRLPIAANDRAAVAANDNSPMRIPLSASPLAAIALPLPLYGSTPQPKTETRQITDDLFLVITETPGQRVASFQRINHPEQQDPQVEHLQVEVRLEGDQVIFDGDALAAAYGRHITEITWSPSSSSLTPIVPMTPEERRLDHNLRDMYATPDEIALAIQQLRNSEAEGEPFMAALRERGARPGFARRVRDRVRFARSIRPYVPPSSGPLVDMFPGLSTAQGSRSLYAVDSVELPISAREYRREARSLIQEIRSIDPDYQSPSLELSNLSAEERTAHLDTLRLERAGLLWRRRQEVQPLQVEMIRLVQRRVDLIYPVSVARHDAGEITGLNRGVAIGNDVDWTVRQELRDTLVALGISEDDVVAVTRATRVTGGSDRYPDLRIANIFIDVTIDEKDARTEQVIGFFEARIAPTHVIIIRPRRVGPSSLITPPRRRYARDR
jgi:hypothetical protein